MRSKVTTEGWHLCNQKNWLNMEILLIAGLGHNNGLRYMEEDHYKSHFLHTSEDGFINHALL